MGHQVALFLTPTDLEVLEASIRTVGGVVILASRSPFPKALAIESMKVREREPSLRVFMARFADLRELVFREVPSQGCWTIDTLRSPVIEFDRCFFDGTVLRKGRIYYVDKYYGVDDAPVCKSDESLRWAKKVLSVTKRGLKRDPQLGDAYMGLDATAWMAHVHGTMDGESIGRRQ